ncbi:hypothetical protein EK904_006820 [Melospiza melodia maxima]|nr:hypothetical protein EK904_006820 [Melospiza melodia maxima]
MAKEAASSGCAVLGGTSWDLLRLLPHCSGSHQQADPGVTLLRDLAASQCQETPHLQLHCAVAALSYSSDSDPRHMLQVGTPTCCK